MKIQDPHASTLADIKASQTRAKQVHEEQRQSEVRPQHSTSVELSGAAKHLADARAEQKPDLERIERLRAAIEDGSFEIDPARIAERMLEEER
ncbi:MAG: flagellar biosynthesis anti-sigma factor FlgM [Myxococcota bacterium]